MVEITSEIFLCQYLKYVFRPLGLRGNSGPDFRTSRFLIFSVVSGSFGNNFRFLILVSFRFRATMSAKLAKNGKRELSKTF